MGTALFILVIVAIVSIFFLWDSRKEQTLR